MSADNYTYINKKTFEVWSCVASCVCSHKKHCLDCQTSTFLGKGKNLEGAMEIAEEDNDYTEYGIFFSLWCK